MKSQSEIGHDKNVANFEDLISRCAGFGVTYNPSLPGLQLNNMNTLRTNALSALSNEKSTEAALILAMNNRAVIFKNAKPFATRILGAMKACGLTDEVIKDARSINYKIQGQRAEPIKENEENNEQIQDPNNPPVNVKHISVSQQSYDSMVDHYERLIKLLAAVPAYNPNENDLKVSGLNGFLASMKGANTAVINATTAHMNAMIARDTMLYGKPSGLVEIAFNVKAYVKAIYGTSSQQYKEVKGISFRRLIKV
jgi:hypothetical protein